MLQISPRSVTTGAGLHSTPILFICKRTIRGRIRLHKQTSTHKQTRARIAQLTTQTQIMDTAQGTPSNASPIDVFSPSRQRELPQPFPCPGLSPGFPVSTSVTFSGECWVFACCKKKHRPPQHLPYHSVQQYRHLLNIIIIFKRSSYTRTEWNNSAESLAYI